jgi:hypothetical protein
MALLYDLLLDSDDGLTTQIQVSANSREEALELAEELHPGCRLALISPEPRDE